MSGYSELWPKTSSKIVVGSVYAPMSYSPLTERILERAKFPKLLHGNVMKIYNNFVPLRYDGRFFMEPTILSANACGISIFLRNFLIYRLFSSWSLLVVIFVYGYFHVPVKCSYIMILMSACWKFLWCIFVTWLFFFYL